MTAEERIKAYGSPDLSPVQIILKAGQLDLVYENGAIRWIRLGNTEILRMIYSAIRDQNWGTIEPKIENEILEIGENSFDIKLKVRYKANPIHFVAEYHISGEKNKIRFEMQGIAQSDFLKNRIGFCVLHPISECAGKKAKVSHPDGSTSNFVFPKQIAALQPVKNIQSMNWNPVQGISAILNLSGNVFEMEDQRNWIDASFKTYCTPLELPFPTEIKTGELISQVVELIVDPGNIQELKENDLIFSWNPDQISQLPELGLAISSRKETLSLKEIDLLKKLPAKHLRIELKPKQSEIRNTLEKASRESQLLGWPLFVVLYFSEDYHDEYHQFVELCIEIKVQINYLLPVGENHISFAAFEELEPQIRLDFPDIQLGTGVNAYFAELNRTRPDTAKADFVSFMICPQVHAFDYVSLVENLEAQSEVVKSAQSLFPGKPIFISPVSLRQRFNVVATVKEPEPPEGTLPSSVDPRQQSVFAASWTLGSLKFLAQTGASMATYYETVGWKGFLQGEFNPDCQEKFHAKANDIFPVYEAMKETSGFSQIIYSQSSHPLLFDGLVVKYENETRLFLFNFTSKELEINIEHSFHPQRARSLLYPDMPEFIGGKLILRAWDFVMFCNKN